MSFLNSVTHQVLNIFLIENFPTSLTPRLKTAGSQRTDKAPYGDFCASIACNTWVLGPCCTSNGRLPWRSAVTCLSVSTHTLPHKFFSDRSGVPTMTLLWSSLSNDSVFFMCRVTVTLKTITTTIITADIKPKMCVRMRETVMRDKKREYEHVYSIYNGCRYLLFGPFKSSASSVTWAWGGDGDIKRRSNEILLWRLASPFML